MITFSFVGSTAGERVRRRIAARRAAGSVSVEYQEEQSAAVCSRTDDVFAPILKPLPVVAEGEQYDEYAQHDINDAHDDLKHIASGHHEGIDTVQDEYHAQREEYPLRYLACRDDEREAEHDLHDTHDKAGAGVAVSEIVDDRDHAQADGDYAYDARDEGDEGSAAPEEYDERAEYREQDTHEGVHFQVHGEPARADGRSFMSSLTFALGVSGCHIDLLILRFTPFGEICISSFICQWGRAG